MLIYIDDIYNKFNLVYIVLLYAFDNKSLFNKLILLYWSKNYFIMQKT